MWRAKTWNPCKCDHQSRPWLERPHMIKCNCKEPFFQMPRWFFWKCRKEGFKTNSEPFWEKLKIERKKKGGVCACLCECVCAWDQNRIFNRQWVKQSEKNKKVWFARFTSGLVLTCTRWAGRAFLADKVGWGSGAEPVTLGWLMAQSEMLKSTEREHVSAARARAHHSAPI